MAFRNRDDSDEHLNIYNYLYHFMVAKTIKKNYYVGTHIQLSKKHTIIDSIKEYHEYKS
jgi:hypothetical protein